MSRRRRWSGDKLSNEELTLIFIRLPLNCVHRCKCVSKRWLTLISDPYFIRHYIESHKNSFHHDHFMIHTNHSFDAISLPSPPHQINPPKQIMDFSLKFIPPQRYWDFDIMATSNGLLLCNSGRIFYVCNPLTRGRVQLPPLPYCKYQVTGFICYPMDSISSKVKFIVLLVEYKAMHCGLFDTQVFISTTGKWESHEVVCPRRELCWERQHALVYNNIFHWRCRDDLFIMTYDPINQPNDCKPISFPVEGKLFRPTIHHIELSDEGHIRMISTDRFDLEFFHVWELTDYDNELWNLKYQVKNPNGFTVTNTNAFFSQTNGEIVYLIHLSTKKLIVFNMKNGSPEEIIDLPLNFDVGDSIGRAMPYVATPWPTPVPQIPLLQQDQDLYIYAWRYI